MVTVTPAVADVPEPSVAIHVIVALPGLIPFTVPLLTVATLVLEDVQVTSLFLASVGLTFAVIEAVFPSSIEIEEGLSSMRATGRLSMFGSFSISCSISVLFLILSPD